MKGRGVLRKAGQRAIALAAAALVMAVWPVGAGVAGVDAVGMSFPAGFPVIEDGSLGVPVIGFGGAGPVERTPVIFLHGNNDTPFPTACNPFYGDVQAMAQFFLDNGYAAGELWGLGYQGDQCDLLADQTLRSGEAHATVANVPDVDRFVRAVLAFTGARRVDVVGHSLGVTLAREWMRERHAYALVRRFVAIDGPNHGIVNCSPNPLNFWQLSFLGGFTPGSAVCREYGSPDTAFLRTLNRGHGHEQPGPALILTIRNADTSFVYFSQKDGLIAPVPAEDSFGNPHDFSQSARIAGAANVDVVGQGAFDPLLGTAHLGILNSPEVWQTALDFLTAS